MQIAHLFEYSENCRHLLRETLLTHESVFLTSYETVSTYTNIRDILVHIIGAEERLITMRLENQPLPLPFQNRAAESVAEIFEAWDAIRTHTFDFLQTQNDTDLHKTHSLFHNPLTDQPIEISTEQVLFHIVNHENYHRGQIVMLLQQKGIQPPAFDYPYHLPTETVADV